MRDAHESLARIEVTEDGALSELIAALSLLIERLTDSFASKESALATVQLSMLELEAAQEELRTKEERYRELFSKMNDGVVVFEAVDDGEDFALKDINNASLRIEQTDREAVVGRRIIEVFPGVEELGLLDVLRSVYNTGIPKLLPARFYQDQRISGWRENFVYRLPTKEVVAVYRDVSEQKAADKALRSALKSTEQLIDAAPIALVVVGEDHTIRRANEVAGKILGARPGDLVGRNWRSFVTGTSNGSPWMSAEEGILADIKGNSISVLMSVIPVTLHGEEIVYIEAFLDLTERKRLETQLRHAQKLEAVGQLAAGIAHEINTPVQFVGDNIHFMEEAFGNLQALIAKYRQITATLTALPGNEDLAKEIYETEEKADMSYIVENAPAAFAQALEGVSRISTIVLAMKEFAHPDLKEKSQVDINRALQTTLTIANNEYKYVAEVETELGELPLVSCHAGDMNQVFLNLVVNAAHAIADVVGTSGGKGHIRVRTTCDGSSAVRIEIEDTGSGIPAEIRERVFDPFFTTKEVGRGSGQGLAIARNIVVNKHQGSLTFESEVGKGTTFTILLPVDRVAQAQS